MIVGLVAVQGARAQTSVVIERSGFTSPSISAHGSPYVVVNGVGTQAVGSKGLDIAASKAYCDDLVKAGRVRRGFCEPNYRYHSTVSPNDPLRGEQYAHSRVSLPSAWNTTVGSSSLRVAIIDTGVDADHPDLSGSILRKDNEPVDGVDNDSNGFVDDASGWDFVDKDNTPSDLNEHGTHCAGIAAGIGNNGVGVSGAAWNATIIPVRVLDAEGSGFLSDIATGVRYAVDNGASVLSLSLGGSSGSEILERALSYACSKGAFIAVAAGNESADNDNPATPSFPANYNLPCLVSVAASDNADNYASFSNYGATKVHLAAPGVDILSTLPGNRYGLLSGTSMATPLVAGIGILVKSAKPELSGNDIKTILLGSVDTVAQMQGLSTTGGRVNANNALALALGTTPTAPDPVSDPSPTDPGSDPDPDPAPAPEEEEAIEIEEASVSPTKVRLTGYVYTVTDEFVVEDVSVLITCFNRKNRVIIDQASSRATDEDGYFTAQFPRRQAAQLKGGRCFLSTPLTLEQEVVRLKFKRR
jgi:subtilisin family serine protease